MKDFRKIKAYRLAHDLALDVLGVMETMPEDKDIDVQRQFCESGTKIGAKIAASSAWPRGKSRTRMLLIAAGNVQVFDSALTMAHERRLIDEATYGRLLSKMIDVRDELNTLLEAPFRDKKDEERE